MTAIIKRLGLFRARIVFEFCNYFDDKESAKEWVDSLKQYQAKHPPLTQQQKKARKEKRSLMKRL